MAKLSFVLYFFQLLLPVTIMKLKTIHNFQKNRTYSPISLCGVKFWNSLSKKQTIIKRPQ